MSSSLQLWKNNARTTIAAISSGDVTVTVGSGSVFPTPGATEYFLATIYEIDGVDEANHEVVKVTGRVGNVLTIVRDYESMVGAGGLSFPTVGGRPVFIEIRVTAGPSGNVGGIANLLAKDTNLAGLESAATSRTNLGLGTMATQAASAVAITGGTMSGVTLQDSTLLFADNVDITKKMQFELSSIGAGLTRTITVPNNDITLGGTNIANSWLAAQTFAASGVKLLGSSTGLTTFGSANASATDYTITFPAVTDTVVLLAATQELTTKTLTAAVAKGTWTASGTWTLPAFTLGGTVTGGSNNITGLGTIGSTAITVTSSDASALAVGRLGATTPALKVDAATATSITGVQVKSAAAGGGVAVLAIGETNVAMSVNAAGSGAMTLNTTATGLTTVGNATGGVTLSGNSSGTFTTLAINVLPTGTGVASAATASTVVTRDANANLLANHHIPNFTTTATAAGTTVLTVSSAPMQEFTGATTQTITLPTTGVVTGQTYTIINASTGLLTVNASGGALVKTVSPLDTVPITCRTNTPTTAAHWSVGSVAGGQMLGNAAAKAIAWNAQTIDEDIVVGATQNAGSFGPVTVNAGKSVTVTSGGSWKIL